MYLRILALILLASLVWMSERSTRGVGKAPKTKKREVKLKTILTRRKRKSTRKSR